MTSAERSIVAQQQVIPDRGRNVQQTNSCKTSVSKVLTQGAAAEVLERARLSDVQAQQLEERLVLLQEEEKKKQTSSPGGAGALTTVTSRRDN